MRQKILAVEKRLGEIDGEIREFKLESIRADDALKQARLEAEGKCHESALRQVGELRRRKAQLVQASLDIKGGFLSLMKGAGLSSKKRSKGIVQQLRLECMNDKIFKDKMGTLRTQTEDAKRLIQIAIQTKKQEKQRLRRQVQGMAGEAPQAAQKALKKAQTALDRKQKEIDKERTQRGIAQQAFQADVQQVQQEIQSLGRQLQEDEDFLANKQQFLGLKQRFKVAGLKGDSVEALGAVEDAKNRARSTISKCGCPDSADSPELKTASTAQKIKEKCESAYRFLSDVFPDEDYPRFEEIDTSVPSSETAH